MIALRANDDDYVNDDTLTRNDDSTSSKRKNKNSDTRKLPDERQRAETDVSNLLHRRTRFVNKGSPEGNWTKSLPLWRVD